jgi:hypothetical protein
MKQNRSLAISTMIKDCQKTNILNLMEDVFPEQVLQRKDPIGLRDRVFTPANTLLTMVLTATQEDKSLKNSVALYYGIHQKNREQLTSKAKSEFAEYQKSKKRQTAGRPRKNSFRLPKSKTDDISLNTAAYSKARKRLPTSMTEELFAHSRVSTGVETYSHWHDRKVFIGDGTYVQMQDTPELREQYAVNQTKKSASGYPQGLIVGVIERGTGQVHDFGLSNRHTSELAVFYKLIETLPSGSLVLLDDLYNCYEIMAKCLQKNIDIIVPSKRKRNFDLIKKITPEDEIIEIHAPKKQSPWIKGRAYLPKLPSKIRLRQIRCQSPEGTEYILHSTILDENISANEFQIQYLTRWDIEISIREIKTIMDINILRSKTPEMVIKELNVALATYNLTRKIIFESIEEMPFPPKEDFIQKFYTLNKNVFVDKKGRVYSRWSPGRRGTKGTNKKGTSSEKAKI